ncbi:hypothetical protein K450DRAFT_259239 [Umbelopsis ramanniana AG]|uniref:Uncharacterized protein n=1 Tax=Umbelopsis ramanniana AG TaxID=1314678 RepID=A0AAD5HBA0_UMBRA|nr:uncharacterized protein K450DRAFT_259239 [Umbelopsis ramanniana AG]KAI8575973.1 hypothetical protein K450DRAFT_259239 [Umbelopsis ramanniana AG]
MNTKTLGKPCSCDGLSLAYRNRLILLTSCVLRGFEDFFFYLLCDVILHVFCMAFRVTLILLPCL